MPSSSNILLCAGAMLLFGTGLGWLVARRLVPDRGLAWSMAPCLGWAVFNAAALPILQLLPFTRASLVVLVGAALVVSSTISLWPGRGGSVPASYGCGVPWWAYAAAAILALAPAIAILPKFAGDGVLLADPVYDHSKVAMIDDIARIGLPAGNPFFAEAGTSPRLAYYYLWHFSAAIAVRLFGIGGWEADIAQTWFTAFASLTLMMGLAVWFSRRRSAALLVAILCAALTIRPVLAAGLGARLLDSYLSADTNLEGWLSQATWVPQHLASASSVVLAMFLISNLAERHSRLLVPVLALVVAAGFESSTWIGGITFAAVSVPVGLHLLWSAEPGRRWRLAGEAGLAAAIALALVFPFVQDQILGTAARGVGLPIALQPYEVLGPFIPDSLRPVLDPPAYWLVFLIIEFPAIFPAGCLTLWRVVGAAETPRADRRLAWCFALLAATGFAVTSLFASTIANNDLGWRAVLPALMVLTIFAAVGLSRWLGTRALAPAAAAILLFLLGLPDGLGFVRANATGIANPSAAVFARSPELWDRVRRHSAPDERVANNPLFVAGMVTWPVNISWALLADRRSCFAGRDLALAYVSLPSGDIDGLEALFERVFAGQGSPAEIRLLARRYSCRVVVVTAEDGAWRDDGFAASDAYRLVEENPGKWRIYRGVDVADPSP
jgi:hypothetical protein